MSKAIRVGQIVGAFGIKGQVKVKLLTDFIERFDAGKRLRLNDQWMTIDAVGEHKGMVVLKLDGVSDRSQAESLQWSYLEAMEGERPELDEDEFLTSDLVGLSVFDESGSGLGKIDRVDRYPAHDVFVIGKVLVPVVSEFVVSVDLEDRKIVLRPIPGMFDEAEE